MQLCEMKKLRWRENRLLCVCKREREFEQFLRQGAEFGPLLWEGCIREKFWYSLEKSIPQCRNFYNVMRAAWGVKGDGTLTLILGELGETL